MMMLWDNKLQNGWPFYMKDGILRKYVSDNKQVFDTAVISLGLTRKY